MMCPPSPALYPRMPPRLCCFFVLLSLLWLFPVSGRAQDMTGRCMPFAGERMLFSVGWEFIDAGTADMRVGKDAGGYHIITTSKSYRIFDLFHKVRDTITSEGVCRNRNMQSTLFDIVQNEGRYHARKQVRFLWKKGIATHTQNGATDSYNVPAGHLNAIDAFFAVRKMNLSPGTIVHVPLFDSRKQYMLDVAVLKTERLMAPWGKSVECLVIEPRLKTRGIFSSKGKVKVWLTNDARHIPLKIVAKIRFGHIVARLRKYTHTNDAVATVKTGR